MSQVSADIAVDVHRAVLTRGRAVLAELGEAADDAQTTYDIIVGVFLAAKNIARLAGMTEDEMVELLRGLDISAVPE